MYFTCFKLNPYYVTIIGAGGTELLPSGCVALSKVQQTSDWGAPELSKQQVDYAASDVLYLHGLKEALDGLLEREGRTELAQACFDFLPRRAQLDLLGWEERDIFAHS